MTMKILITGGAQVIPIESKDKVKKNVFVLGTQEEARRINSGGVSFITLSRKPFR